MAVMDRMLFNRAEFQGPSPGEVAANSADPISSGGQPRLRIPQRDQVQMHWASLDQLLESDHPARAVWDLVCGLDLSAWLQEMKAVEGQPGRNGTDPRVLLALWVYATVQAVASARRLADLCEKHLAYQWLCGGVTVNHHLLSDFRSQSGAKFDELLTQIVAALMAEELVTLQRVAQDGMKVRAHAGKASFRRKATLERCLNEARQQVETLRDSAENESHEISRRAAQARAAAERQQRVEEALRQCEELQQEREASAKRSGRKPGEARASTTDPEARVMKFSDGGYRPGYNVQFSTDTGSGIIVGVEVTNAGTDNEELPPMLDQIEERYQRNPDEATVDGGFATQHAIEDAAENHSCTVYAPLKDEEKQLDAGKDPYARKKGDSEAVAQWRERMGTAAAKAIYRLRCQTAEWVNAGCRNRGLWQMPVRGQPKCRGIALLYAITHNLLRALALRAEATMNGT
jgi:transposase